MSSTIFKAVLESKRIFLLLFGSFLLCNYHTSVAISQARSEPIEKRESKNKTIRKIELRGIKFAPESQVYSKIPYIKGQLFDPTKTSLLIKSLYKLGYFEEIEVKIQHISDTELDLFIFLKEKPRQEELKYKGLSSLKEEDINKKLKLSERRSANEDDINWDIEQLKRMYREKNYHKVEINPQIEHKSEDRIGITYEIKEGPKASVRRVFFAGNCAVSTKKLRSIIFTKEDWILGFLDKAGMYAPEIIEYDKHLIENYYQSNGFMTAHVRDVQVNTDENQCINITYVIDEGEIFRINKVTVEGNEYISSEILEANIPIKTGSLYSRETIRQTMESLRQTWGRFGFIYADVNPDIRPDYENKTVDIHFQSELGDKIRLNRITITGNKKTRDYVIRRTILLNEGDILTTGLMDLSKARVEQLGYFDPKDGVNWRIDRVDDESVDLELILKEIKAGKMYAQLGYGGAEQDIKSPAKSIKVMAGASDPNLFGTGIVANVNANYSKDDRGFNAAIFQPYLFNKPIGAGLDLYHRKSTYSDFRLTRNIPVELLTGFSGKMQINPFYTNNIGILLSAGADNIKYPSQPRQGNNNTQELKDKSNFLIPGLVTGDVLIDNAVQNIINSRFIPGLMTWAGFSIGQDLRNHPIFPSRGYSYSFNTKIAIPNSSNFGFTKLDFDFVWLTPIIDELELVFLFHAHAGVVATMTGKDVPYRELYNIGGLATVRGFTFGQIGPQINGSSIGAKKALWVNAELQFPITLDKSIRALLFYDGGAGWDAISNSSVLSSNIIANNNFNYRHAIGFGIRLLRPTPLRVDWGFKLDKKRGEKISEVHFTMSQDF